MAFRLLQLLLCLLLAAPAHLAARPENRVGGSPSFGSVFVPTPSLQPAQPQLENPSFGHGSASGVCKYLYCHANPVNGTDPSGQMLVNETLASMTMRVQKFEQRYKKTSRYTSKAFKGIVEVYVSLNLVQAFMDPALVPFAAMASPYNAKMLKEFDARKPESLVTVVTRKIPKLASFVSQAAVKAKLAEGSGLHIPIKPTGFPDFGDYVHPVSGTVFIPLTGDRKQDEIAADAVRLFPRPPGYTWHHHEVPGIMQLVNRKAHKFGHCGGVFFWEILNNQEYKWGQSQ